MSDAINAVMARLEREGAMLVPIDLTAELEEIVALRLAIVPTEFTQWFGKDDATRRQTWEEALPLMGSNVSKSDEFCIKNEK